MAVYTAVRGRRVHGRAHVCKAGTWPCTGRVHGRVHGPCTERYNGRVHDRIRAVYMAVNTACTGPCTRIHSPYTKRTEFATFSTRRPASADSTARRQFQATGQPVSGTQDSDAMMSRLPRYEAKCVQRSCFQCGSVRLRSDIKGTELPPVNILIPLERQLTALQLCR